MRIFLCVQLALFTILTNVCVCVFVCILFFGPRQHKFGRDVKCLSLLAVGGAQFLFDGFLRCLREVGRLYVLLYADQRLLQRVEGAGVQHLLLNFSGIWAPRHEEQLLFLTGLRRALALVRVFEIEQTISALSSATLLQILKELVVLGVAFADRLHVDLFLVANVKHHVAVLLILFYLFVRRFTSVRNCYTRRHFLMLNT